MPDTIFHPPLVQIAFSVIDVRRTERWFREGLGFLASGGNRLMMSSPLIALIQGLPRAASTCWWMVGRNPWFQLEMFQFRRPMARLLPADFRPCDTGYTRIGVTVADFDATLERLADLGSMPLSAVLGERGKRRACVRNPDGVFVEVMEDDPLPQAAGSERSGCDVAVRSVTLSSPDLAASVAYLTAIGGKAPQDIPLHAEAHEALWGLPGAKCDRAVFAFGDVLLEVVQYTDLIGKPWPEGYRLSDQRILNIAVGARNRRDHEQVHERAMRFGARPNFRPIHMGGAGCVYENDRLGFSVEVLWMRPGGPERKWGFVPLPASSRPEPDNQRVEAKVLIEAPLDTVWNVLTDQDRMSGWIGFDPVTRVRDGWPDRDGVGSERRMKGPGGTIVEQVIGVEPKRRIRYRVIEGSPFIFHNGEITVEPRGNATEVSWSIRFRSRIPLLGAFWRSVVGALLARMLSKGLKPFAERSGAAGGAQFDQRFSEPEGFAMIGWKAGQGMFRKVFVTGGNGFIGRALMRLYRERGAEVCGMDLQADRDWNVVAGDLIEPASWQSAVNGCDLLIHTAALLSNTSSMMDSWRANVLGTRRALDVAVAAGVRRFVHISSVGVFGFEHETDVDEKVPLRPIGHPYVDSKIASEHTVLMAHTSGEIECTIVRPGDVYGPASRPWVVLPLEILKAGRFLLPARGQGIFSPVYIDDLVDGIVRAAESPAAAGQVFNLTGTEKPTCAEYFGYLARMLGKSRFPCVPTGLANVVTDVVGGATRMLGRPSELGRNTMWMLARRASYSIEKARRLIGYEPRVTLADGMARVEQWCREHRLI